VLKSISNKEQVISQNSTSSSSVSNQTNTHLSAGAKAGVSVGVIVAVLGILAIAIWYFRRRRSSRINNSFAEKTEIQQSSENWHDPVQYDNGGPNVLPNWQELPTRGQSVSEMAAVSEPKQLGGERGERGEHGVSELYG
jgi:hypothetical protein